MPCYTQQTSVVEFSAQTDPRLLAKALEGLGFTVTVEGKTMKFVNAMTGRLGVYENGTMTLRSSSSEDMNVYKRAYSAEVVKSAAQRFGWAVKQAAPNTMQVTRRA